MTTETINGLHKCQPKNEPIQGETKNLIVVNMPGKNGKKAWIKIKNQSRDEGGSPYRIISVEPTGWEPDDYGNVSYNLEIEAVTNDRDQYEANPLDEKNEHSHKRPVITPQGQPARQNHTTPTNALDERQHAIIRQHSQSMALEMLKLKYALNELTVEDLTPAKLRQLADYFDSDVLGAAQ